MLNFMLTIELKPGVAILLMVLIAIIFVAFIFLLYRGVKKERFRFIAEKLKINELDKVAFDEMLQNRFRSAGKNTHFSVMYFELHDAKNMKEAFGDKQFNNIREALRERLYGVLPKGSKICLYEEDLLVGYIEEDLSYKELCDLATFCLAEAHKPISLITRVKVELDLNIGINSYNAFNSNMDQFVENAELALAYAKRQGINRYVVYSAELMEKESDEYKYYQEIKSAIANGEFTLYYQPIVDLSNGSVFAYESLLRWNHRTLGVLSPAKFLHILEQSGDIQWVGQWAFEQLVIASKRYHENHPNERVVFTFNLSLKQLLKSDLTDDMRRILKKYRVAASDICVEIAEGDIFNKQQVVAENIEKLRQCGFLLAVDDFGLDMSSLRALEAFKLNWVKLDKSFIEQSKDDFLIGGVVEALVKTAERGGMKMIAEGVEDEVVLDYIKERGIPYGQGYHFGKPLPPQDYHI
jgi:EAL domain-containing protein (putative c-di-GMP-specific phosphodiesterase class I)/GGDEF domain-containing protein